MHVSLGRAFSQAFDITVRRRFLWVYGILLVIFGGQCSLSFWNSGGGADGGQELDNLLQNNEEFWLGVLVIVLVLVLLFWLLSIVIGNWALGSLIGGIGQSAETGGGSLSAAAQAGAGAWLRLVGIGFLTAIAALPLVAPLVILGSIVFLTGAEGLVVVLVLWLPIALIGIVAVSLVATLAQIYAVRTDLGVFGSLGAGWRLFTGNAGDILVVWLANDLAVGCATGCVTMTVIALSVIPAVLGFLINPALGLVLLAPALLFLLVIFVITGIVKVFQKAIWVLAYRDLTGPPLEAAPEPPV